jgi:hypothetical protein
MSVFDPESDLSGDVAFELMAASFVRLFWRPYLLQFPDCYGRNLDAFNDCMGDVTAFQYGARPDAAGLVLVLTRLRHVRRALLTLGSHRPGHHRGPRAQLGAVRSPRAVPGAIRRPGHQVRAGRSDARAVERRRTVRRQPGPGQP